jgi:hypothetical protein
LEPALNTQNVLTAVPRHPYPGVRTGGLFLVVVGSAYLVPAFWAGFAAGFLTFPLFGSRLRRPFGAYTPLQVGSIVGAVVLEIVLIMLILWLFQDQLAHGQARTFIFALLFVVGIHFVPFAVSSGPLMLLLAALCCANALAGLLFAPAPVIALWIVDGLLKIGVGAVMLRTPVPLRPSPAAS